MGSRLNLQSKLEELLGGKNVYYQPPETVKMSYPAIKYSMTDIDKKNADNSSYMLTNCYEIIVIDPKPDNPVLNKLLSLPMCTFDRPYKADNLNHYVFKIYY